MTGGQAGVGRASHLRSAVESGALPSRALDDDDDGDDHDGKFGAPADDEKDGVQYNYSWFHLIFMLASMYCTVGHLHPDDRGRVRAVALSSCESDDPAVRTWGRRAVAVIDAPESMDRSQWCGFPSLAYTNPIDA